MTYIIRLSKRSEDDLKKLKRNEPQAFKKVSTLLNELEKHPRSGTGHPEQLKEYGNETWSRRITKKHRLVYSIEDQRVLVLILSSYGHYDDK